MKKFLFLTVILSTLVFTSCQKTEDYVSIPFTCGCGSQNFNGSSNELQGAEYVFLFDDNSRRYYTTADITNGGDLNSHNLNFTLEIDDVNTLWWDIEETPLAMEIEEVNNNQAVVYKYYAPTSGIVEIIPAIFGTNTSEVITYNLLVRQVVGGSMVGPEIAFNGSFNVEVEYEN